MRSWPVPHVPVVPVETPESPQQLCAHDTSTRTLCPVGPTEGTARLYVCGITPYDATHLGHANTYLSFDLLNRTWRDLGLQVQYTQNVTDVDDPLLERATRDGVDWRDLAAEQTNLFRTDMEALRVLPPDHYVGASESIDLVVGVVERLRDMGAVYQVPDEEHPDWYYDVTSTDTFMDVSGIDEDAAMARFVDMGGDPQRPGKRNPFDCLVWLQARPGEPAWDSPLGRGRPGWHIECTGIALQHLGETFDVQGGGSDLAFPHHEMCAAQAHTLTGRPFAQSYLHSGLVALDGEKMSKSRGNLELVSRLRRQGVDPMVIRLAMLAHHWRDDWEWAAGDLDAARDRLATWQAASQQEATIDPRPLVHQVRTAMRTDLDAPAALRAVDAWCAASLAAEGDDPQGAHILTVLVDALLGIAL